MIIILFFNTCDKLANKSEDSINNNKNILINELKKDYLNKKTPEWLKEFIKHKNNKTLIIIYIPKKVCFSCIETLFFQIKDKRNYTCLIIDKMKNPSILGLIKYYKYFNNYSIDDNDIFKDEFLKTNFIFSPIIILVHKGFVIDIDMLDNTTKIISFFKSKKYIL